MIGYCVLSLVTKTNDYQQLFQSVSALYKEERLSVVPFVFWADK